MGATLNPGGMNTGFTLPGNWYWNGTGFTDTTTGQPVTFPGSGTNTGGTGDTGTQPLSPTALYNNDPFNLPMFGGPYSAPLTQGQMDSLQGYNQLFNSSPLLQTEDLRKAIDFSLSGGPVFAPNAGKTLTEATEQFKLPSGALNNTYNFNANPAGQGSFDTTPLFQNMESVFNTDLNKQLARVREESSGLGLGPMSTDRERRLGETAGDALARFRVGQLGIGNEAFEAAKQREIAGRGQNLQNTSLMASLEEQPFNRMFALGESAANRSMQAIPYLFDLEQRPYDRFVQQYGLNEAARNVAQGDIQTRLAEFARTQGGGLNQLLSIMSGVPQNNTGLGPSTFSQLANLIPGLAAIFGGK